jgi:protein TonB
MISGFNRRLALAITLSVALHLLVIAPLRLPVDDTTDTLQLHLQASVSRTPPAAKPPAKASPPPKKQTPPAKQLTTPTGAKHTAAPKQEATPPDEEKEPAEPVDAIVLDQPLLPEYPPAALAQNLEGCVLASVQVNASGEVDSVTILAADHPGVFDESVITAQKSARYAPARQANSSKSSRVLAVAAFAIQPGTRLDCPLKYATQAEKLVRDNTP